MSDIRLLLVTDIPEAMDDLAAMLAPAQEIEIVGMSISAEEAISAARRLTPDVAVMDYDMPGLNGAEIARTIALESPDTQVIMLSVVNDASDIRHAMRAGARDYLVKPLAAGELVETIRWLIRERRDYARMQGFVDTLRKAYDALFYDDKPVPDRVVALLESQLAEVPHDRQLIETLAVVYARNRNWAGLKPLLDQLLDS